MWCKNKGVINKLFNTYYNSLDVLMKNNLHTIIKNISLVILCAYTNKDMKEQIKSLVLMNIYILLKKEF